MTRLCAYCENPATMLRNRPGGIVPLCDSLSCYSADLDVEYVDTCPHNVKCFTRVQCEKVDREWGMKYLADCPHIVKCTNERFCWQLDVDALNAILTGEIDNPVITDVAGYLPCGCHGTDHDHSCDPYIGMAKWEV